MREVYFKCVSINNENDSIIWATIWNISVFEYNYYSSDTQQKSKYFIPFLWFKYYDLINIKNESYYNSIYFLFMEKFEQFISVVMNFNSVKIL